VPSISAIYGKERRDFAEFYVEYESLYGRGGSRAIERRHGRWATTGPIAAVGHSAIGRGIAHLKAALASTRVIAGFVRVEASPSVLPRRQDHTTRAGRRRSSRSPMRCTRNTSYRRSRPLRPDRPPFLASYYDVMVPTRPRRLPQNGWGCRSKRSITRCTAFPRSGAGITSAGAAGTARTPTTSRSWTSSI
jgi:hypothetical protein